MKASVPQQPSDQQEKIDFFLISAHELRTSLSAMKWLFKLLIDGDLGVLTDAQRTLLLQATDSNERMIGLINDTMNVIKAEGSSTPYVEEPIIIEKLLSEVIADFTSEAAEKGMHIRYSSTSTETTILGDIGKLRIALHNLLENAIKYGNPNSDIALQLSTTSTEATISIRDNGMGIPEEEQGQMFTKFFRASNARAHTPGVGLGLYATKAIIERHHGSISFATGPTGTIFTITLPISQRPEHLPKTL